MVSKATKVETNYSSAAQAGHLPGKLLLLPAFERARIRVYTAQFNEEYFESKHWDDHTQYKYDENSHDTAA